MTTIIQYAVIGACERFGHNGIIFNTAGFQSELSRLTRSEPFVTPQQADAILLSTSGVTQLSGGCHWSFERFDASAPAGGGAEGVSRE